ncbi:MAG TPA: hypothetical protein VJT31_30090 [Rugosimonospora sp.]|nr:hypothetical protein [Rugosimonospora sp.]
MVDVPVERPATDRVVFDGDARPRTRKHIDTWLVRHHVFAP